MWDQEVCPQGQPCTNNTPVGLPEPPCSWRGGGVWRRLHTECKSCGGNEVGWGGLKEGEKNKGEGVNNEKVRLCLNYGRNWEKSIPMGVLGIAHGPLNYESDPSFHRWGELRLRGQTEDKGKKGAETPQLVNTKAATGAPMLWFWAQGPLLWKQPAGLWITEGLEHRGQTQGLRAESGPPPRFIRPSTLFLPGGSAELSLKC